MRFYITRIEQLPPIYHQIEQALTEKKRLSIEVKTGGTRSLSQLAYLWGVVYPYILEHLPDTDGWRRRDLHEWFLMEYHGHEIIDIMGRKRARPLARSPKDKVPFMDFIAFIQQKMAEMAGLEIPDPE